MKSIAWVCNQKVLKGFRVILSLTVIAMLVEQCNTMEKNKFKTCDQSGFCKRQRWVEEGSSKYTLNLGSGVASASHVQFDVVNEKNGHEFILQIFCIKDGTFRLKMNEKNPLFPRYEVENVVATNLDEAPIDIAKNEDSWVITNGKNYVVVQGTPMRVLFYSDGQKAMGFNGRQTLKFEELRKKPDANDEKPEDAKEEGVIEAGNDNDVEYSMWEESFGSHRDSKPRGPESIGVDIDFFMSQNLYGIPEHADSFRLKDTRNGDPYRLYNLDVFEFELDCRMGTYASIPFMLAHSSENTVGMLWLNAAETWVDIKVDGGGLVDSIVNLVGGSEEKEGRTRWISESGIIDVFFFMGPTPLDVIKQYSAITGVTPQPQMWSLGSHQCRWNYNDQDDVLSVDTGFDDHDIPVDSIWLDIEHTDGKKYFTWDLSKFPNPVGMIQNISSKGRKMVTIIDPHIKREAGYFLHEDALSNDLYVKDQHGKVYEGWCWPGSSSYVDLFDPKVRKYWASRFQLDKYPSTLDLYTWNDMNEPSVFNGPEVTMPKDLVHFGNWEHRSVHNMYGLMNVMATFEGHLKRSDNYLRPFILTRSAFPGSQKYAAIWTGDNMAKWDHLKSSIPMCLSLSISGLTQCGADIGGFFYNPNAELLLRWYQAAAFQPFMRNHAHIDTKRREPWLFGEKITSLIRSAVRKRYALLPFWYTLFRRNEVNSEPPMRPVWINFPQDIKTFTMEDQYMLGSELLVHPVTDEGASSVSVYLPKGTWFDFYAYKRYEAGTHKIEVGEDSIPVFQRGGTVIPTKQRIRRSSKLMKNDPYTLFLALDQKHQAKGSLYIDDGESYEYKEGKYLEIGFQFLNDEFKSTVFKAGHETVEWVERIVLLGYPKPNSIKSIEATSRSIGTKSLEWEGVDKIIIRKPGVKINENFSIKFS